MYFRNEYRKEQRGQEADLPADGPGCYQGGEGQGRHLQTGMAPSRRITEVELTDKIFAQSQCTISAHPLP